MLKLDVKVDDLQKALQAVSSTINDGIMFSFRGKKLLVKSCNDKVENNYMIILDKEVDEACFYVAANLNRYISGLSLKEEQYIKLDFDEVKVTVASKKTKAAFELINPENFVSLAEKVDASTKSLVFDIKLEDYSKLRSSGKLIGQKSIPNAEKYKFAFIQAGEKDWNYFMLDPTKMYKRFCEYAGGKERMLGKLVITNEALGYIDFKSSETVKIAQYGTYVIMNNGMHSAVFTEASMKYIERINFLKIEGEKVQLEKFNIRDLKEAIATVELAKADDIICIEIKGDKMFVSNTAAKVELDIEDKGQNAAIKLYAEYFRSVSVLDEPICDIEFNESLMHIGTDTALFVVGLVKDVPDKEEEGEGKTK